MVSVIIPVYNCEQFLEECIESVIGQSYSDIEILLVNDGSTDGSLEICKKYAGYDERIHVISHDNRGVAKTREAGLEVAKGEFITFIDSDDKIANDYLEKLYNCICDTKTDVVCCNSIDENVVNKSILEDIVIDDASFFIAGILEGKRFACCLWAKLYRYDIIKNIQFREMKYAEDSYYVTEVFQKAKNVALMKYSGYFYRTNLNGAMSNSSGIQQEKDVLTLYKFLLSLCETTYPQYKAMCINNMYDRIFNLISKASVSTENERIEAFNIINEILTSSCEKVTSVGIKYRAVRLYLHFPKLIMFLLRIYKKVNRRKKG